MVPHTNEHVTRRRISTIHLLQLPCLIPAEYAFFSGNCAAYKLITPVPVAARSRAEVCGRSPAEIVGSNPTGRDVCLSVVSVVCCQVEVSATS